MISKEHFKKSETQNDSIQTRRWRKRRKLHVPCLNFSDTENSDSIGDFKITNCVIKQKLLTGDFKKRIYGPLTSNSRNDGFLNASKFINDNARPGKLQGIVAEDAQVEFDGFKLFMPDVFKRGLSQSSAARLNASKSKPTSTTYEQLGLSKKVVDKRNARATKMVKEIEKKHVGCGSTTDGSVKKYNPVWEIPQKKEESALSAIAPLVSTGTKPWMQFCRNAQKALAVLNDEVSSALRDSFCSIDDIQMRIRRTMDEIRECDKMYEHLRMRQNSTLHLKKLGGSSGSLKDGDKIFKAFGLGSIQSHSENQIRVAPLPSIEESIYESEIDDTKVDEQSAVNDTVELKEISSDSSAKLVSDIEAEDTPDVLIVPTPTPVADTIIDEVFGNASANDMDLRRKQGQWNLHNNVCDGDECDHNKMQLSREIVVVQSQKPMIQIVAEELYVPEKINRIASTNLNNTPSDVESSKSKKKSCQFLYREKVKKPKKIVEEVKKSSTSVKTQMKYADSVLFAKRNKNTTLGGDEPCSSVIQKVIQNDCKLKQECKSLAVQSVNGKSGLDCFDILDEITLHDLKPLESEYPRKDNFDMDNTNQIQNTYLYKLVNGPMQDEFLKLLRFEEPRLQCGENCEKCDKTQLTKIDIKRNPSREGVLKSSVSGRKSQSRKLLKKDNASDITLSKHKRVKKNAHDDIVSRLKPYMFDPHMRYPTTITVMPAMITTYTNPNFVKITNKALAEKNQVGDYAGLTRYTSKLNKPVKYLNRSSSNIEKKKGCTNKPIRTTNQIPRFKATQEKMHGDAWDDYETPSAITSSPKVIKRRNFRSSYESYPNSDLTKFKLQKMPKQNKWEANIQSVIEMIETKIVEILSDPEKTHLEAFKSVETKILEILNSEKSLQVIEEGSQVDAESDKFFLQRNFRSKTMYNLKRIKDKKIELRSKTDVALTNFPTCNHPSIEIECCKKQSDAMSMVLTSLEKKVDETTCTSLTVDKLTSTPKSPSSELFQFLDSISNIVTEDVVHYNTKKFFYRHLCKIPSSILLPQVYNQIVNYGIYSKKFVERKPTTPIISKTGARNSENPLLTASTRTYKILSSSNASYRKTVLSKKSTITRPREQKRPSMSNTRTVGTRRKLSHSIIYNKFLNYLYAALFAIVFFGLIFNYTCQ